MHKVILAASVMLGLAAAMTTDIPLFGARDAYAVIGRPGTPRSVAGVARRTVRHTAARTGPVVGAVAVLPAGCVMSGAYYVCGGVYYQPYYDGPNLVYVRVR